MSVKLQITQYGYKDDPDADSLTEAGWGGWGNKLTGASCALTQGAVELLGLTKANRGAKLLIDFTPYNNGHTLRLIRFWDDKAPEDDYRLDLYNPGGFDAKLPDDAQVSVIPDNGSTEALPL